jgi:hypothetical protein
VRRLCKITKMKVCGVVNMEYVWIAYLAFTNPEDCNALLDKFPQIEAAVEVQCVIQETGYAKPIRPVLRPWTDEEGVEGYRERMKNG